MFECDVVLLGLFSGSTIGLRLQNETPVGGRRMNIIQCDGCTNSFQDSLMWWSGHFWFCQTCVSYQDEEEQEQEDLCSCYDGEIDVYCSWCF